MMQMAPELQRRACNLPAAELVAICTAAARVRFYDAALLGAVTNQLRRRLGRRSCPLGACELVAALGGLAELNAYDREFFIAAARFLAAPGIADTLDADRRQQLLASFKAVKHEGNEAFLDALAQRARADRYEAAKKALWNRNLSRMYGDTQDLQGWAVDTERALLKRPRNQLTRER